MKSRLVRKPATPSMVSVPSIAGYSERIFSPTPAFSGSLMMRTYPWSCLVSLLEPPPVRGPLAQATLPLPFPWTNMNTPALHEPSTRSSCQSLTKVHLEDSVKHKHGGRVVWPSLLLPWMLSLIRTTADPCLPWPCPHSPPLQL